MFSSVIKKKLVLLKCRVWIGALNAFVVKVLLSFSSPEKLFLSQLAKAKLDVIFQTKQDVTVWDKVDIFGPHGYVMGVASTSAIQTF